MRSVRVVGAAACLAALFILPRAAPGAEIELYAFNPAARHVAITVAGEIRQGDLEKLRSIHEPRSTFTAPLGSSNRVIMIQSLGGDVLEAMRMGRWLRQNDFEVGAVRRCASSCLFVLAAGINRITPDETELLIHRPYLREASPSGSIQTQMREVLELSKGYFSEMNIPESLADEMFSIEPARSRRLSRREVSFYRLNQEDFAYHEAKELDLARRLGLSRDEYIARRRAYEESGAEAVCLAKKADSQISCLADALHSFDLLPQ